MWSISPDDNILIMHDFKSTKFALNQILALTGILFLSCSWMTGGLDWVAYIVYSASLMVLGICLYQSKKEVQPSINKLSLLLLSLGIWLAMSYLWSINRFDTTLGVTLLVIGGLLYEVTRKFLYDAKLYHLWQILWIGSTLATVIWGIGEYMLNSVDGRFVTLLYWPNATAAYLMPVIIYTVYRYSQSKGRARSYYLVAATVLSAGFWLTFSRSAYIIFVPCLVLLVILVKEKKKWILCLLKVLVLSVLLASTLYFIRSVVFKNNININTTNSSKQVQETLGNSLSDRESYWSGTLNIIKDYPVLGTGYGTFRSIYQSYQLNAMAETNDPHNIFLRVFSEAGLVGFGLLSLAVLYLLSLIIKNRNKNNILIPGVGILAVLAHAFFSTDFIYPAILFLVLILLGIVSIASDDNLELSENQLPILAKLKYVLYGLAAFLIIAASLLSFNYFLSRMNLDLVTEYTGFTSEDRTKSLSAAGGTLLYSPDIIGMQVADIINEAVNGDQATRAERLEAARKLTEKAISADPFDNQNYLLLAKIYDNKGDHSAARQNYELALSRSQFNNLDIYVSYIGFLARNSESQKALELSDRILTNYDDATIRAKAPLRPNLVAQISNILTLRAILLIANGDNPKAIECLKKALALNGSNQTAVGLLDKLENTK